MPEFGLSAATEPVLTGAARNPWNQGYSTGGSSGGSAALVASGVVPLAHGNDGGGSIRIPAACCGLVGLKPTRNRLVNMEGTKFFPVNLVHQGVLTRSVRDTAYFIAGAEKYYSNPKLPAIGLVGHPGKKRLRIAFFYQNSEEENVDSELIGTLRNTAKLLESLGHRTEAVPYPFAADGGRHFLVYYGMLAMLLKFGGGLMYGKSFDAGKLENLSKGLSRYFLQNIGKIPLMLFGLKNHLDKHAKLFQNFDILMSPVISRLPPPIGYFADDLDFPVLLDRLRRYAAFTPAQNVSGAPAISLPLGMSKERLPVGLQFSAAQGQESTLLELAYEIEAANPFPKIWKQNKSI